MQYDSFRCYTLKSAWEDSGDQQIMVKRRYSDFEWLRQQLINKYADCAVPILPDKSVLEKIIYTNESEFVKDRMRKLNHFLGILISHPTLKRAKEVKIFVTQDDEVIIFHF